LPNRLVQKGGVRTELSKQRRNKGNGGGSRAPFVLGGHVGHSSEGVGGETHLSNGEKNAAVQANTRCGIGGRRERKIFGEGIKKKKFLCGENNKIERRGGKKRLRGVRKKRGLLQATNHQAKRKNHSEMQVGGKRG